MGKSYTNKEFLNLTYNLIWMNLTYNLIWMTANEMEPFDTRLRVPINHVQ